LRGQEVGIDEIRKALGDLVERALGVAFDS